jgi:endonuclease III
MTSAMITAMCETLHALYPEAATELTYTTPFELLVATVLSAQATDKQVNRVTPALFAMANTPETCYQLSYDTLCSIIRSVNYYKTKAKHLQQLSYQLIEHHHAQVPNTREALEALPGVGRKTANIVLSLVFQQPVIAVDTHVQRVAKRLGLSTSIAQRNIENDLLNCIPSTYIRYVNTWFVLHGRYVCKARVPLCHSCSLSFACSFKHS